VQHAVPLWCCKKSLAYAIAPATFERFSPGLALGYSEADIAQGRALKTAAESLPDVVLSDVQAAVDFAAQALVANAPQGSGSALKVGIVGYCWGGLLAWRGAARLRGISAAVPYYGGGMHTELGLALQCPVMAHFSDNDASLPMDGVAALQVAYPQVQTHVYPAAHGFNCDQRGAWHAQSALLARQRTLAFFAQHLAHAA
jgi:carboxymethylenebutenolidase